MIESHLDTLGKLLEPIATAEGCELVDIEITGRGRRRTLRIFIDREGGVTVEDCARVSRQVELELEVEEAIEGPYTLEVSSPGLTRPLKKPKDYARALGRLAVFTLREPVGKNVARKILAVIEKADETRAVVVMRHSGERVELPYSNVAKAHLEIEP